MKNFILRAIVVIFITLPYVLLYFKHSEYENLLKIISLATPSKILSVIYEKKIGAISQLIDKNN